MSTIVIVGFPGAGKSTIGRKLADKLNMTFIDLFAGMGGFRLALESLERRDLLSAEAVFDTGV